MSWKLLNKSLFHYKNVEKLVLKEQRCWLVTKIWDESTIEVKKENMLTHSNMSHDNHQQMLNFVISGELWNVSWKVTVMGVIFATCCF